MGEHEREAGVAMGRELRRRLRGVAAPTAFLTLLAYFSWNAMEGDRGLRAYAQRQEELKLAQADLARAEAERDTWERRVSGLRSSRLDIDTLDERARAMLNLAEPTELVVPYGQGRKLF